MRISDGQGKDNTRMYAYHRVNTATGEQTVEMEMMTKDQAAKANDALRQSGSSWRWALVENLRRES